MENEDGLYEKLIKDYEQALNESGVLGERIADRLDQLSRIGTTEKGGVTRIGYSSEEKQAKNLVIEWMKAAGLQVKTDGAGNVFGRLDGSVDPQTVIMSGSHVDSVPNGGNFDGPLGVIAALEVVEAWKETNYTPSYSYEVVIFSDEEGSRFKSGLTGSRAFMGKHTDVELNTLADEAGQSFDEVIEQYGSNRSDYLTPSHQDKNIALFVELHIEQGTVLESQDQSVGIVNGIAGPAWLKVEFIGEAGHAGNTAMGSRKDPVVAMGKFVEQVEKLPGKVSETAVATVGKLNVIPNGVNVIAERVQLMVDIRDIKEEPRDRLVELISEKAEEIAAERDIQIKLQVTTKIKPLPIAEDLQNDLAEVIEKFGLRPIYIPSGAGHDAMIVGEEYPAAMLFVRSKAGISHRPEEWTSLNDCVEAVHVLKKFIEKRMENN